MSYFTSFANPALLNLFSKSLNIATKESSSVLLIHFCRAYSKYMIVAKRIKHREIGIRNMMNLQARAVKTASIIINMVFIIHIVTIIQGD